MDSDHVWTHVSDEQAAGRACVMCARSTGEPGWQGVVVGRSATGSPVYACSGGDGPAITGDAMGRLRPDPRPAGRDCAEQAATVVPDTLEGLDL